jgi:hypothetical protein
MATKRKRRPPLKHISGIDDLNLRELGVGAIAQIVLFTMSLFPFVGIVIGTYYSAQDAYSLRAFGRILLAFAFFLHFVYFCVVCPFIFYTTILR